MALDDDDKARAKFNKDFRKITAAEVKKLTDKQKTVYDEIKKNENIAAVPKKGFNQLMAGKPTFRLREFDSETYAKIKRPLISPSREKRDEMMAKRRAEANKFKTNLDFPGASKGYSTELGMKVPKRNPARRPAPKEGKAFGGTVRGRKANYTN